MNASTGLELRAIQRAEPPITPLPEVYESSSLAAWSLWDAAVRAADGSAPRPARQYTQEP